MEDVRDSIIGYTDKQPSWASGGKLCSYCKLWFSTNTFNLHYTLHPSEIIPGFLFLGSYKNAQDIFELNKLGIKRILNVTDECIESESSDEQLNNEIVYLNIPLRDDYSQDILDILDEVVDWLKEAETKNEPTLVHCMMGASRSASMVIAYVMVRDNMDLATAYSFVKGKRFMVRPNQNFFHQLSEYEIKIRGGIPSLTSLPNISHSICRYSSLPSDNPSYINPSFPIRIPPRRNQLQRIKTSSL